MDELQITDMVKKLNYVCITAEITGATITINTLSILFFLSHVGEVYCDVITRSLGCLHRHLL